MADDATVLRATVADALDLADAQQRHPVAAMLADILAMLDRDDERSRHEDASGAVPID